MTGGLALSRDGTAVLDGLLLEADGQVAALFGRPRAEERVFLHELRLLVELALHDVTHRPVVEVAVDDQQVGVLVHHDAGGPDAVLLDEGDLPECLALPWNIALWYNISVFKSKADVLL